MSYLAMLNARVVVMAQHNLTPQQQAAFTDRAVELVEQYNAEDGA